MEDIKKARTFIATKPSENYANALLAMDVCLKYVERNYDKTNELTKKKIIGKSEAFVKKNVSKQKFFIAITSSAVMI